MKKTIIVVTLLGSITSIQSMEKEYPLFMPIEKEAYYTKDENITLYHGNNKFLIKDEDYKPVQSAFVDKQIRNLNTAKLLKYLQHTYLVINKTENGDYAIHSKGRLPGGGLIGAQIGFWLGKGLVYAAAGSAVTAVRVVTAGSSTATIVAGGMTNAATGLIMIEATSNNVGLALGIWLGALTGPL